MAYGTINADVIGTSVTGSNLGAGNASIMKNRIINGAMVIDARNAGASVTPNNTYTLDRWGTENSVTSKFTVQQNAGSVTPPVGFKNYLGVTSSSAYSSGASDYFDICQRIEGYNVADLGWGTANAKTVTLSFWVYSSLTGTFSGALQATAAGRSYPFTYTVSSANTWTQASITIAGDTSGTWNTTNGLGIQVCFDLGSGSNLRGTAGSWSSNWYIGATGSVSVVGTSGATFYITGVQLEVGSSATGYEYRQYGQEFDLCRRYCEVFSGSAEQDNICAQMQAQTDVNNRPETRFIYYPKRANPSVTLSSGTALTWQSAANTNVAVTGFSGTLVGTSVTSAICFFSVASGVTAGALSGTGYISFNGSNKLTIDAEL